MLNSLHIAKILLWFWVLTPVLAVSGVTNLPVVSVVGTSCDMDERVTLNIRLEAGRYAPAYCYSEVDLPNGPIRYPHAFYLSGVTVTDYHMSFGLDIDVMERLKQNISKRHPSGITFQGDRISNETYFKQCNFQLNEVVVFTQETSLIIRDSFYNRLENTFKIPQGTTRTADYSMNRSGNRIKFKVFVLKN